MKQSFRLIVLASISFGLVVGSYDFLLPFYMESKNISFGNMGLVFSLSSLAMILGRIFVGRHSDRVGRKPYFVASLGILSIANLTVPLTGRAFTLALSRTMSELSKVLRDTVQSVAIFDHARDRFLSLIGKANGPAFIFEGVGICIAGALLKWFGFSWTFVLLAAQMIVVAFIFAAHFREGRAFGAGPAIQEALFSHRLPRQLWLIALSSFFLVTGMSASHCFVMPLFFAQKFQLSPAKVALILAVHRIALGVPMLAAGRSWGMSNRTTWIVCLTIQSVMMLATGLVPNLLLAMIFWWGHDLFGGGIFEPIMQHYTQRYSRDETRGHDLGRVRAISSSGWLFGPLIAGWLAPKSISLPFIASGLIALFAVFPVFFLPKDPQ